jgi:cysteinyl-tRNA synthetase
MKLSLFNSLTRKREIFIPINDNLVKMYVCGPTVYDHPHIGNARSVVVYDILYRILSKIFGKNHVVYVRNITDIDDKIINKSIESGIAIPELTKKTTEYFHQDMEYLGCLNPNFEPKATDHVQDMINIIDLLLGARVAYKAADHVYFDITKAVDYTRLSGQSFEALINSVRIDSSEGKRNPGDFVLWKPAKPEEDIYAKFDSPYGVGRPGWHIECSAMSHKFLGENFDIHGGGVDLLFPHHTNEIAQSRCAFPNSEHAKTWVHNGFLTVNHEKMSKSLGNFTTVKDLINKGIKGEVARLFLLSNHYRKPLDYNDKAISDAAQMITYWYRAIEGLEEKITHDEDKISDEFMNALLEDMNINKAVKIINDYAKEIYVAKTEDVKTQYASKLLNCARFIGLMNISCKEWFCSEVDSDKIEKLIKKRALAKEAKNWSLADSIRKELEDINIAIEDKADGLTLWKKKI